MRQPGSPGLSTEAKLAIWVLASAVLMVIGALGPWSRFFGVVSVSGTDGNGGKVVLTAGLVVGGMTLLRLYRTSHQWVVFVAVLAALIGAFTSILNLADNERTLSGNALLRETGAISTGWGLWLDGIASISAFIALLVFGHRTSGSAERGGVDSGP